MTSTVSTTVKVIVSMVVVAALVATTFNSKASTGLKGTRKLQFSGITLASSQGVANTGSAVTTGVFGAAATPGATGPNLNGAPGGTGASFGNGMAIGTSNGFIQSAGGQAIASGTSGGNSTSNNDLTVLSANPGAFTAATGGGLSGGTLASTGIGQGAAGGNAVFGPSLSAAIAAATPAAAPPAPEVAEVVVEENSKNGGNNKNNAAAAATEAPAAPTAPAFSFTPGLSTGGGGGGFGLGAGTTTGAISSPDNINTGGTTGNTQFFADEAYGTSLSNGFGFGVGSGVAINSGGEQAGGSGGATALGQGNVKFELDDIQNANFANSGTTESSGGAGAYVGFNPPAAQIFGAFNTPPPAAGP